MTPGVALEVGDRPVLAGVDEEGPLRDQQLALDRAARVRRRDSPSLPPPTTSSPPQPAPGRAAEKQDQRSVLSSAPLQFFESNSKNKPIRYPHGVGCVRRKSNTLQTCGRRTGGEARAARATRPPRAARARGRRGAGQGHRRTCRPRAQLGSLLLPGHRRAAARGLAWGDGPLHREARPGGEAARGPGQASARDPPRRADRARRRGEPSAVRAGCADRHEPAFAC